MSRPELLVSVDVGGTLGTADGPGLTMQLVKASPLPPERTRAILRSSLHTRPALTDTLVSEVCEAIQVPTETFPRDEPPAPFSLFPGTIEALHRISSVATVVTLSNVTCADADTDGLRALLSPWVNDFFPSCSIGYTKPDPRAFRTVTDHFGRRSDGLIHIGDDWTCDILGAVEAGARAVWISHGRQVPDDSLLVDHGVLVADDLAAAASHIQHLSARSAT
jgi:FMN phosphatase YigB (HAD superfamily)